MRRTLLKTKCVKHADEIGNRIYLLKDEFQQFQTQIEVIEDVVFDGYLVSIWKLPQ